MHRKNKKQSAFDLQNLAPKTPKTFAFELHNGNDSLCQVYLNLRDIDNNQRLNEIIYIESSESFKATTFAKLLKKQSIFLSTLKPKDSKIIFFTVTLDGDADNSFQGQKSNFKSAVYSFCLNDPKDNDTKNKDSNNEGQVKGTTTELENDSNGKEDNLGFDNFYSQHKTVILLLSFTVLGSLVWNFVYPHLPHTR